MDLEGNGSPFLELSSLGAAARELVAKGRYQECEALLRKAMEKYPHAPEPHNLMGALLEKKGERPLAMKHFRAARALDPAYLPARYNLSRFAAFQDEKECAFDETDCQAPQVSGFKIEQDEHGVGHVVKR